MNKKKNQKTKNAVVNSAEITQKCDVNTSSYHVISRQIAIEAYSTLNIINRIINIQ